MESSPVDLFNVSTRTPLAFISPIRRAVKSERLICGLNENEESIHLGTPPWSSPKAAVLSPEASLPVTETLILLGSSSLMFILGISLYIPKVYCHRFFPVCSLRRLPLLVCSTVMSLLFALSVLLPLSLCKRNLRQIQHRNILTSGE